MGFALLKGCLVVGVYLDGEVFLGIDKLDKQGELVTEALVVLLTHKSPFEFTDECVEALTLVLAVGDEGFATFNTRDLPTLADRFHLYVKVLKGDDLVASPERLLQ